MDHHTIKRTRWLLEALAVAGAIIVVAYAAFSALVPLT